ncbi:MAG TPA: hypothetical protein VMY59_01040 [Candidatus Thermoplasmatota archaeon]|nr:hypothetical protein [Candidatus Thermoplasmatota archaeon]
MPKPKLTVIEKSFLELNGRFFEHVYDSKTKECRYVELTNGKYEYCYGVTDETKGIRYIPPCKENSIVEEKIKLPKEPIEYGDLKSLVEQINKFIYEWLDVSDEHREIAAYYIVLTWIYDRLDTIPYLRALGDMATGKGRYINTIGKLCYKPIPIGASPTPAVIFRLIEAWRGSLIINEFNPQKSDESDIIMQILNNGFERGLPIWRVNEDTRKVEAFESFGPKIFGARKNNRDNAFESRCLTENMHETLREDIPDKLPPQFEEEQQELRCKLLDFRMKALNKTMTEYYSRKLNCIANRRVKQTITPFIILTEFDKDLMTVFNKIAEGQYQKTLVTNVESPEGQYLQIFIDLMNEPLPEIQSKNIKDALLQEGIERSTSTITRCLKGIGFTPHKSKDGKRRVLNVEEKYFKKIVEKYIAIDGQKTAMEIFQKWTSTETTQNNQDDPQTKLRIAKPYKSTSECD